MPHRPGALPLLISVLAAAGPAAAGDGLWLLQTRMQSCIDAGSSGACGPLAAQVKALSRDPAYSRASHLCKEEIAELSAVVALLPMRDAVATDLMASVADVQQACLPYGF